MCPKAHEAGKYCVTDASDKCPWYINGSKAQLATTSMVTGKENEDKSLIHLLKFARTAKKHHLSSLETLLLMEVSLLKL